MSKTKKTVIALVIAAVLSVLSTLLIKSITED